LVIQRGFFGLIAEGWDLEDTTGKARRGSLPAEAIEVERIVGLFDSERGSGVLWTVEEFSEFAPRALTDVELKTVRAARSALFRRWLEIPSDQKLELTFEIALSNSPSLSG